MKRIFSALIIVAFVPSISLALTQEEDCLRRYTEDTKDCDKDLANCLKGRPLGWLNGVWTYQCMLDQHECWDIADEAYKRCKAAAQKRRAAELIEWEQKGGGLAGY